MADEQALIQRAFGFLTSSGLQLLPLPNGMLPPTVATVREIDIQLSGNHIDAKFTRANYNVDVGNFGGLSALLSRVVNNTLAMDDDPAPKAPYKSKLSLQNRVYCYVILRLTGKNWQFSEKGDPFSIGLESTEPEEAYFEARRVDAQGNIVPPGAIRRGCMVAYFIADGASVYDDSPIYEDPFNFHLDLMDTDDSGQPSPVPIIIDPDIRFPGGSGT